MKNKRLAGIILGLLVLQFILGMLANLYSSIPHHKPYEVFQQFGFILFHALNGTLLMILSAVFIVKNRRQKDLQPAIGGLVNIILAFIFGELFVFTQNSIFSLLMALAFIGALMFYARIVFSITVKKK